MDRMSAFSQFGYSATSLPSQILVNNSHTAPATSCCESGRPIMTDPATGQTICSCQYDSARLLSSYPRVAAGLPMYGSPYADQPGYVPAFSTDPSAFYSPISYDASSCYPYDPAKSAYPYPTGYGGMEFNGGMPRKNATREATSTLKAWLHEHIKNPYPTKGEKIMLAIITKMTLTQVSTWFANARRRLKKENKMTWSPRYQSGGDEKNDSDNENDEGDSNNNTSNNDDRTANDSLGSESDTGRDDKDGTMKPCNKNDRGAPTRGAPPRVNALGLSLSHASSAPGSVSSASSDDNSMTSPTGAAPLTSVTHGAMALASGGTNDGGTAKPKIWSLAHTATSESPPTMRRSPPIGMPSQLQGMASLNSPVNNLQQWMNGMFHNSHHPAAAAMSRYQILPGINVSSVGGGATGRLGAPNAGLYGGAAAAAAIGGIQRLGSFSGTGALQANNQGLPSAAGLGSSALNYAGNGLTATTTLPGGALASGSVGVGVGVGVGGASSLAASKSPLSHHHTHESMTSGQGLTAVSAGLRIPMSSPPSCSLSQRSHLDNLSESS